MAQEFVVLQCCQCMTYQVQQSRKATKWLCKVCNQKQSIKQFFGSGSAKECRRHVQTLNGRNTHSDIPVLSAIERADTGERTDPHQDLDSELLELLLNNENNDSNDDVSIPKRKKLSELEEKSCSESETIFWTNSNQLVNHRVSKWSKYLK